MKRISIIFFSLILLIPFSTVSAHRSGCHRWHSCPSDTGSYVCGDLGYTSGCPKAVVIKPKVVVKKFQTVNSIKTSSITLDKNCLDKALKVGNTFLKTKGYKENKDGSWTNGKGSYPTSKISTDLDIKQTTSYNGCIKNIK